MKTTHLKIKECLYIPKELEDGVLYLSPKFKIAVHLCACGCRVETVTPIDDGTLGWILIKDKEGPTLKPSIGNMQLFCKSHYCVTNGQIVWC